MELPNIGWELFINILELVLFVYYIKSKMLKPRDIPHRMLLQGFYLFVRLLSITILNLQGISSLYTILISCAMEAGYAYVFYLDPVINRIFWGCFYSVICLFSEYISISLPHIFLDNIHPMILIGGILRLPFTLLYLTLIATIIFLLRFINRKNMLLSNVDNAFCIIISIMGISIGHMILLITLYAADTYKNNALTVGLSLVNMCYLLLFLALLQFIYQLGVSKKKVSELMHKQRLQELEELEFKNIIQTTDSLRELKHDMQQHLSVMQYYIDNNDITQLKTYVAEYQTNISNTVKFPTTGNSAIDCILGSKLVEASRHGIRIEYSVMLAQKFPFNTYTLSSLLGNLLNNALEACILLQNQGQQKAHISFYIKPYHQMIAIHIENDYDGTLIYDNNGNIITKKDKNSHGIGLHRIREIVNDVGGIMTIQTEHNVFSVHILIPEGESKV